MSFTLSMFQPILLYEPSLSEFDYMFFNNSSSEIAAGGQWNFIEYAYNSLGLTLIDIIQHIGFWGALLVTMFLIISLVIWQGNQRERTKVVKNIGTLLIAFILLVNLVSWISFFQKVTYMDSFEKGVYTELGDGG